MQSNEDHAVYSRCLAESKSATPRHAICRCLLFSVFSVYCISRFLVCIILQAIGRRVSNIEKCVYNQMDGAKKKPMMREGVFPKQPKLYLICNSVSLIKNTPTPLAPSAPPAHAPRHQCFVRSRPAIIEESQPVKNRNLSRLNWSSQRNSVYCFSTVFTFLQQQEVPSTCRPRSLPCLVF